MKSFSLVLVCVLVCSQTFAQEENTSDWKIMPSISVTKLFSVGARGYGYDVQPMIYPPIGGMRMSDGRNFSATGISFSARFLNSEFEPFAFTLSAGANWFRSRSEDTHRSLANGTPILFDSLRMPAFEFRGMHNDFDGRSTGHFMSFPVSIGAQILFPYEKIDKLMFFAGIEGNLHIMSQRAFTRRQVEAGFSAVGGVAIKMFECGVRYSRFAGTNNVGVHAGIRLNSFSL